jgi:hypothetical protein
MFSTPSLWRIFNTLEQISILSIFPVVQKIFLLEPGDDLEILSVFFVALNSVCSVTGISLSLAYYLGDSTSTRQHNH